MTTPDLSFQSIEIRQMPGFPQGGLSLKKLCPGVNIVYGPNASGKTTLGKAISSLLKQSSDARDRDSLRGCIELHGTSISIDRDFGYIKCQNLTDGSEIDRPHLAPADMGNSYVLALHDLVNSARDHDLAKAIGRELAGGYDVAEASQELEFQEKASGKGKRSKAHIAARSSRRDAEQEQQQLIQQQQKLVQLQADKQQAMEAASRLQLLEKTSAYLDSRERFEETQRRVATFADGMAKITGQEIKELDQLKDSIEKKENQQREEQRKITAAQQVLTRCNLPEEGVSVELIGVLRKKSRRLSSSRDAIQRAQHDLSESQQNLVAIKRSLGPDASAERTRTIDTSVVEKLFKHLQRVEAFRARKATARTLSEWLETEESSDNPAALREAVLLLHQWVAVNRAASTDDRKGHLLKLIAAGVVLSSSLLLGFFVHPSWYGLAPIAIGLLGWAFWPTAGVEQTGDIQSQYDNLQVGSPRDWTEEGVREQLRDLQQRCDAATLEQERRIKWGNLAEELQQLRQEEEAMEEKRQKLIQHLGIDTDEATLSMLAANLERLQSAQQQFAVHQDAVERAQQEFAEFLNAINDLLSPFGMNTTDDPDVIAEQIEDLSQRQRQYASATQSIEDSKNNVNRLDEDIRDHRARLLDVYRSAGLTPEQETTLRLYTGQKADYDEALNDQRVAQAAYQTARTALTDRPELLELSREALHSEQQRCREQADQLSPISTQIGGIENAIATAREGDELEVALAYELACADELREQRNRDCDLVIGNVLANFIDRQESATELPVVLRRARELFSRITHGRYELHVPTGEKPEFRAVETAGRVGLGLDQLSSGTRLQLLLAARLAFVERQEQGVKLPLVFDETLGNSDERRATEIIDAAIEICRQGRQVFYFTAQYDEVAKWKELLKDSQNLEYKIVDLAEERQFSESERIPFIEYERPKPVEVPAPEGCDWIAYGQLLRVPRLKPETEISDCHLWYLIDDPSTLHQLLKKGINKWGQLQSLVSIHRVEGMTPESENMLKAKARERLLRAVLKSWNIGRGRTVDRQILMDSGAISETYLDRVSELAAEMHGEGKAIIRALEASEVRGFRTDKRQELEEFLVESGYIDERETLTPQQIQDEARLAVYADLEKGLIDQREFQVLVSTVVVEPTMP